tara:strand:+ start:204 stop:1304 length:1101 start_codon:yes stop_codon:yes gene_type:complete
MARANVMKFSIIILSYNMEREIPRTIFSVSPYYQKFSSDDYEIILVQNGGNIIEESFLKPIAPNLRSLVPDNIKASPCYAINYAASKAKGENLIICIDGARIWSKGILVSFANHLNSNSDAVLTVPAYHLGWDKQAISANQGYNQEIEDRILEKIGWPSKDSNLYEISSPAGSNRGPNAIQAESNCISIPKDLFNKIGGYDERLSLPGGGFCNPEFFKRVVESKSRIIQIETEGTFHQIHGGKSTNNEDPAAWVQKGKDEATEICNFNSDYTTSINPNYYFVFEGNRFKHYNYINRIAKRRNFYLREIKKDKITFTTKYFILKNISSITNGLQNYESGRILRKKIRIFLEKLGLRRLVKFFVNNGL